MAGRERHLMLEKKSGPVGPSTDGTFSVIAKAIQELTAQTEVQTARVARIAERCFGGIPGGIPTPATVADKPTVGSAIAVIVEAIDHGRRSIDALAATIDRLEAL